MFYSKNPFRRVLNVKAVTTEIGLVLLLFPSRPIKTNLSPPAIIYTKSDIEKYANPSKRYITNPYPQKCNKTFIQVRIIFLLKTYGCIISKSR